MSANEQAFVDPDTGSVGLTKRELFAAMAMQAWCRDAIWQAAHFAEGEFGRNYPVGMNEAQFDAWIAEQSVNLADALLAELSKEPTHDPS